MKKVLITGSQGFIGSYLCAELLPLGYEVVGIDDYSKYGYLTRPHDDHENFAFYRETIGNHDGILDSIIEKEKPDIIIANCAQIGGIAYFHKFAYDLLRTNERITCDTFDAAIKAYQRGELKRIIVLSSSMAYENTDVYPTPESAVASCPPPSSTYGFQKLATEYFCKGAWEQYGLPYTILRPFNCVGVGEEDSISEHAITSGNIKLMMSHVLPDLINKVLKGQDPLHILGEGGQIRCYTNGKDLARGIRLAMESTLAVNEDFNISTSEATSVLELAEKVWRKINPEKPFSYISDVPFEYDVQKRIPDISKAKDLLGFESKITVDESIDEVIEHMKLKS